MTAPRCELRPLDARNLADLLAVAVAETDPLEVMPPVPGEPGWNETRRQAFREFHLTRSIEATEPVERTYLVVVDERVAGAARIEPVGADVEIGMWLGRPYRGLSLGGTVLAELLTVARATGARRVVASTTTANVAARRLLGDRGAVLTVDGYRVEAVLDLSGGV
ncbi:MULTISPECIES: GNAT family N-acetyltransferase [Prauserella salsuginis group]|uniref:GNAT family N-acetyltransferase n=1 Tax=Prauserella salsuginis TaxID=387889 RepID=A0ABW6G8S9_9PSEU|nr:MULTISPECIES: GNAT family N-acetyltransferase [Prauserella salsuginis group]MCR3722518.1 Protein N-acetyltransferase, RimJ/RimL family [Prauserella flava]MCR3736960.1 Protein N-acetyltransferase, RimJ/RimL family [Prauserella salsuginis]